MESLIQCDMVSAEGGIFSGQVEMVVAAGSMGDLGIAFGHAPLITQLVPGPIRLIRRGTNEEVFYVSGGMLEVQPKVVTVLADTVTRAQDLEEAAAEQVKQDAIRAMEGKKSELDYSTAAVHLAQAAAQLRAIQQIKKQLGR